MLTIRLTGHVTETGELIFDAPKDLPPGEVQIVIEVPQAESEPDFTEEEIKELLQFKARSGAEVVADGLIGGWEHLGITDPVEYVEEIRRKEQERRKW